MIYFLIAFTVIPALELTLLIKVGSVIGAGSTIGLVLLTGFLGAWLARAQGFLIWRNIERQLGQGLMPTDSMFDGVLILIGGIVLLTPGFITDAMGLVLLIPQTRMLIKSFLRKVLQSRLERGEVVVINPLRSRDNFIDV